MAKLTWKTVWTATVTKAYEPCIATYAVIDVKGHQCYAKKERMNRGHLWCMDEKSGFAPTFRSAKKIVKEQLLIALASK